MQTHTHTHTYESELRTSDPRTPGTQEITAIHIWSPKALGRKGVERKQTHLQKLQVPKRCGQIGQLVVTQPEPGHKKGERGG